MRWFAPGSISRHAWATSEALFLPAVVKTLARPSLRDAERARLRRVLALRAILRAMVAAGRSHREVAAQFTSRSVRSASRWLATAPTECDPATASRRSASS